MKSPPQEYGGLGTRDLAAFSRALRLRWEWFRWDEHDRPWQGTATPCDKVDKALFQACTTISLGDGATARFWTDKWLQGCAPISIAPRLFPLAARKNMSVKEALSDGRWARGLQRIATEEQLDQFVELWQRIQHTQLSQERDTVVWNLTANGQYSAKSAYTAQFLGKMKQPDLDAAWKIWAEGNVKFFFWLLLQNRNWTADRLRDRGWPHDDVCCLCHQEFETANHLAMHCSFAKEVWSFFTGSHSSMVQLLCQSNYIGEWWSKARRGAGAEQQKKDTTTAIYIFWHVWKERCRRIFQAQTLPVTSVVALIRNEVELLFVAKGTGAI